MNNLMHMILFSFLNFSFEILDVFYINYYNNGISY